MKRTLGGLLLSCALATTAFAEPASAPLDKKPATPISESPPIYLMELPAAVSLVAFLPAREAKDPKEKDLFDLDLRVEVVMPKKCGDRLAGLMKRNGPVLDGDAYDAVLERRNDGECKKEPTRVGARWAIRTRIADGATHELTIGERVLKVSRNGALITLDGQPPTGDVPGAPGTAAPATLILGTVTTATVTASSPTPGLTGALSVDVDLAAKWPKCAGAVMGFLGRGDAASRFMIDRFEPLALAPLDGSCGAPVAKPRRSITHAVVRVPKFTVGAVALDVKLPPLPSAAAAKK